MPGMKPESRRQFLLNTARGLTVAGFATPVLAPLARLRGGRAAAPRIESADNLESFDPRV
jgi:hypothetical protein